MELTTIPLQDGFTTKLAQEWDGSTGTMFLQASPSFTFPSGETTYMVVQPNGANAKLIEIDSYDSGNNTVNVLSVTLLKGAGINNPTGATYPTNTEVLISDNYQFWKDIQDAIATKLNLDETSTIEDSVKIQFGSASAYIFTDDSGVNLKFKDENNAESTLSDILAQGGADRKAAVSDDDTTPGQLDDKIVVGDGLSKSIGTPSGDETLDLDIDLDTDSGLEKSASGLKVSDATTTIKGKVELATDTEAQNSNGTGVIQANQLNKLSEDVIVQTITSDTSTTFNVTLNHSLGRIPLRIDYTGIKPDDSFYSKGHFNWNGSTITSRGYVYGDLSNQGKGTDGFGYIYASSGDYYRIEIGAITSTQVVLTLTEIGTSTGGMNTECIFVLS